MAATGVKMLSFTKTQKYQKKIAACQLLYAICKDSELKLATDIREEA